MKYPAASYTFRWSAKDKRWLTWIDGAPARATEGGQLGGSTVIIQYTQISTSRFEEYGGRPPYAKSVGSGRAVILRDGKEYTVRWSRPTLNGGTTYTLLERQANAVRPRPGLGRPRPGQPRELRQRGQGLTAGAGW